MSKKYILAGEILLTALPLSYHLYQKTGNLVTTTLTFAFASLLVKLFLVDPAKTWDNLALVLNPFALSAGTFITALIYLNYTGISFTSAKWQAFGISLVSLVIGFIMLRYWSAA